MRRAHRSAMMFAALVPLTSIASSAPRAARNAPATDILGRWDIVIHAGDRGELPSWLEVRHSGYSTLVGQVVVIVGSARPISEVKLTGDAFHFSVPPQWERDIGDLTFDGRVFADSLSGTVKMGDKSYPWSAKRAPTLRRKTAPKWGAPITLFNGKDLTGWRALGENQWLAKDGILTSPHSGANLRTERTFTDFKLHVEFRYPKESNSGVYLRGRYEVQIVDSMNVEPTSELLAGIYGFLPPNELVARKPGEWQSYDITLVGRTVTVVANGKRVICEAEVPGITGGALDSNEGGPGPIYLQGDHGPIEYRNLVITPGT